jgi:hypothetical protein
MKPEKGPKAQRAAAEGKPNGEMMAVEKPKGTAKDSKAAPKRASKLKQALELKRQYEALIRDAHDDALKQIHALIQELKESGYEYRLVTPAEIAEIERNARQSGSAKGSAGAKRAKGSEMGESFADPSGHYDRAKYCKKCSEHGHDTKAHNQAEGFKEKAFPHEEMARRGFLPPELKEAYLADLGSQTHH